ncbi:MAG: acyl carrier protein [Polyangiaceae bacterium]|nr:acyl carrier protein [Polyangiaceae bacterium]
MTWTRETVRAELLDVFRAHSNAEVEVSEASQLVADLSIDSLGMMEMLADLEDKFKLTIPDEMLREVETIGDVARAIEARLEGEGRLSA